MGQDISDTTFSDDDVSAFEESLRQETHLLRTWAEDNRFAPVSGIAGFEMEAWLIDKNGRPTPGIEALLDKTDNPLLVPELSKFNFELNCTPQALEGSALSHIEDNLSTLWTQTQQAARTLGMDAVMIGILPTVEADDMTLQNMSPSNRYHALNQQVLSARDGKPIKLDIEGAEHLVSKHANVMTEAATTSFQVHLQVELADSARFFNAMKIATAPVLAAGTNSPYLFGYDLWEETRIPLFEQSVSVAEWDYAERVTFGVSYVDESLIESFSANLMRYPVLLPRCFSEDAKHMKHVQLHNGTIWRWNRPLVGFDADGTPNIRLEHRTLPAGPSITDSIANAAFLYGLVYALAKHPEPPEYELKFVDARDNFYAAAQHGLEAEALWTDGKTYRQQDLILSVCLPIAEDGLADLGLDPGDIKKYLGIVRDRTKSGQTGSVWQRGYVAKHGSDMAALTKAYCHHQQGGTPVHTWSV